MASRKNYKTNDQLLDEIGERVTELKYRFYDEKSKEHASEFNFVKDSK